MGASLLLGPTPCSSHFLFTDDANVAVTGPPTFLAFWAVQRVLFHLVSWFLNSRYMNSGRLSALFLVLVLVLVLVSS